MLWGRERTNAELGEDAEEGTEKGAGKCKLHCPAMNSGLSVMEEGVMSSSLLPMWASLILIPIANPNCLVPVLTFPWLPSLQSSTQQFSLSSPPASNQAPS